jgi:hypothetical protein
MATGKARVESMIVSSPRALEFACHSKACAPPPAGKGGSSPVQGPLTAAKVRAYLKDELAGTTAGTKTTYSHQQRGGGTVLNDGISVSLMYPKFFPWKLHIEAAGMRQRQHLATQADAIVKKLNDAGYKRVEINYRLDLKTHEVDKSQVLDIYADEA